MMEQGLAQQMAQPQQAQGGQDEMMAMVEKVIQLLMQGADPDDLVKQGVPAEVIMQAIQIIEQQMAAQQAPEQGLAAKSVGGM
jgi:hypothetical protein